MDFEKAYQKFLDGTATPEEIEFVRSEINHARKLTAVIDGDSRVITNEAGSEKVKKAAKKYNSRMTIKTVVIVLLSVIVVTGAVLGAFFGVSISSAKRNTGISAADAEQLAIAYVEENFPEENGTTYVEDVDRDIEIKGEITKSYYIYEVELSKGFLEIDVEISGKTGEIIFAHAERD